ncbi:hypothetical protein WN093_08275 [Gammaproteobacteria bacterium AS21]|jgi:hypothetical protein
MKFIAIVLLPALILAGCSTSNSTGNTSAASPGLANAGNSATDILATPTIQQPIQIVVKAYPNSDYKQVNASFYTNKSKTQAFKVISNLALTKQWFDRLDKIETLAIRTNNDFVIRSIITSPWPFKDRELISCVHTQFKEDIITIDISNCSFEQPINQRLVRVEHAQSNWKIQQLDNNLVKINYQAWIDPAGNVPSKFFNLSLVHSTRQSMQALQQILQSNEQSDSYY